MALDLTKPVRMKNGTPVTILRDNFQDSYILGMYGVGHDEKIATWTKYGVCSSGWPDMDLENTPETKVTYHNIYKNSGWGTKEQADRMAVSEDRHERLHRVALLKVTTENNKVVQIEQV